MDRRGPEAVSCVPGSGWAFERRAFAAREGRREEEKRCRDVFTSVT